MNTYKKLNQYLLTHQPLIWQTRVIQMTLVVLLLHLVFLYYGYNSVSLDVMRNNWNIENLFYDSSSMLYWIISGLILFIIWGAYFFRFNAAKNFYPISRWYFHKMALCLFVPTLLFFFIPFTFFAGLSSHARKIVKLEELQELLHVSRYSQPFLLSHYDNFGYEYRAYPEVYRSVEYWSKFDRTDYLPNYIYNGKKTNIDRILSNIGADYIDEEKKLFAFVVDHRDTFDIVKNDTCYTFDYAFKYVLNRDSLPDFRLSNVKNYAPFWQYDDFILTRDNRQIENQESDFDSVQDDVSAYCATIHNWIDNDRQKIQQTLRRFKELLDRFQIRNNMDPDKTYEYLISNDFNYYHELTLPYHYYSDYEEVDYDSEITLIDEDEDMETDSIFYEPPYYGEGHFYQYVHEDQMSNLIQNARAAIFWRYFNDKDAFRVLLYFSLAATMLFVYFQWGSILNFIISIPVGGILIFLGVALYTLLNQPFLNEEYFDTVPFPWDPFIYLMLATLVLFVAIFGIKRVWNTYVTNIAVTISYFIAPLWLLVTTVFVNILFSKKEFNACLEWYSTVSPFDLNDPMVRLLLEVSPFVLFVGSMFFLKHVIAKKEG